MCPDCLLKLKPDPTLWPADHIAFIPNPTEKVVFCEQCGEKKALLDVLPNQQMLANKKAGKINHNLE